MSDKSYHIYIYGPESDYKEEVLNSQDFDTMKDALDWAKKYIASHVGYKIYKLEVVKDIPPRKPHYLA